MLAYGTFLRGLLEDPYAVSAPTPSGAELSRRLAAEMDLDLTGKILELGPGTGAVTQALIERGVEQDRLILLESSGYFCDVLRRRFPGTTLVKGDAFNFERYLEPSFKVAGILSGLPLLNFPVPQRRSLVERALRRQDAKGRFVQLSYGWKPPVPDGPHVSVSRTAVWRNLPPAFIWTYTSRVDAPVHDQMRTG